MRKLTRTLLGAGAGIMAALSGSGDVMSGKSV